MLLEITSLIYMIFYKATGAGKRNRTPDLLITNELLYRLSYSGVGLNYSEVAFWLRRGIGSRGRLRFCCPK